MKNTGHPHCTLVRTKRTTRSVGDGSAVVTPPHARTDETDEMNQKSSYGKIDAAAGIEYIKKATTVVNNIESDKPAVDSDLWFDNIGRIYNSNPTAPGIYINLGHKYIIM